MSAKQMLLIMAAALMVVAINSLGQIDSEGNESWERGDFESEIHDDTNEEDFAMAISFEPGSAALSQFARSAMESYMDQLMPTRDIEVVYIAVWADEALPGSDTEEQESQVQLADERITSIKSFLARYQPRFGVDLFNMAELPSFWGNVFGSDDAQLKRSVSGNASPDLEPALQIVADYGQPGFAVLSTKFHQTRPLLSTDASKKPTAKEDLQRFEVH